jgi:hypothetical protein
MYRVTITYSSLSGGDIAGIVVGCLVAIAGITLSAWYLRRKHRRKRDVHPGKAEAEGGGADRDNSETQEIEPLDQEGLRLEAGGTPIDEMHVEAPETEGRPVHEMHVDASELEGVQPLSPIEIGVNSPVGFAERRFYDC